MEDEARTAGEPLGELGDELYEALLGLARRAARNGAATLDPTEVVHEAWVRLARSDRYAKMERSEFLAVCATLMRHLLVDDARRRQTREGAGAERVTLTGVAAVEHGAEVDLLALDEALDRLQEVEPRWARVVQLRFFGALTNEEVAQTLGVSVRTVTRDWALARGWLRRDLRQVRDRA